MNKTSQNGFANITVNGSKHSFVKAQVPPKRGQAKQLNEISGILLANQKPSGTGGHIR